MERKKITKVSLEQLEAMPTRQLLGRLKSLHQCEESPEYSDRLETDHFKEEGILFKQTVEWSTACKEVKQVLARREHVAKGKELAEKRRSRAHLEKNRYRRSGR